MNVVPVTSENPLYKSIIKNIGRFENIKLSTGVILDTTPKRFRAEYNTTNFVGISTKSYGNYWFKVNGKEAIFKSFDAQPATKSARIVNELLCMELCKQIGLKCATYEPATIDGNNGIISYNVANSDETMISACELKAITNNQNKTNSLIDYYRILKTLKNRGTNIDLGQEIVNMYKLAIFDLLTLQTDRHSGNIFFLNNKKSNTLRLSPIFDNELSFLSTHLQEMHLFYDFVDIDLVKDYYNDSQSAVFSINPLDKKYCKNKYETIKKDIIRFANKNERAKKILKDILEKFNIKSALRKVEQTEVKIPLVYKNYVTMITETIKNDLKNELEISNNGESIFA